MEDITKHYTNGEVTIVWQPARCIHSSHCWKELPEVFDFKKRPWVNAAGAETDRIRRQVDACPSRALSYFMNGAEEASAPAQEGARVEVTPNGPLMAYGTIRIKDQYGVESVRDKVTAFCRCGASANKPFCDGSHNRVGFKDELKTEL